MEEIQSIRQEAIDLEVDCEIGDNWIDLDQRMGSLGGTFANNPAGRAEAQGWLSMYRSLIETNDQERSTR